MNQAESWISSSLDFVMSNSAILAFAILGTGVVGLSVWYFLQTRDTETKADELVSCLEDTDSLTVLMHPDPDPDAMACALGLKELAESVETAVKIKYPGGIRHQENRAFETVLDVQFEQFNSADELTNSTIALVDHYEPRGFTNSDDIQPEIVIDHHPQQTVEIDDVSFLHTDIDAGSCSTLVAEYFSSLGWTPYNSSTTESVPEGQLLSKTTSTGLLYGILTDTTNLTENCGRREFEMATYLQQGASESWLQQISTPDVDEEILETRATAINKRDVRNSFAISFVGNISNRDAIPQAADELLQLEGVKSVIILATCDGLLHFSGRSNDARVHMGNTLRKTVSDIPNASAGGHAHMGGGTIPMDETGKIAGVPDLSIEDFTDILFDSLRGDNAD